MLKKLRKQNQNGFTLVELIVVLVILAVLAALMIPALTGYIDKAQEAALVTECRQVVVAAQSVASERYGKGLSTVDVSPQITEEILTLADMKDSGGKVKALYAETYKVQMLVYENKAGKMVTYTDGDYEMGNKANLEAVFVQGLLHQSVREAIDTINKEYPGWENRNNVVDSGAVQYSAAGAVVAPEVKKMLKKNGLDPEKMGSNCWQYCTKSHASAADTLNWTLQDVSLSQVSNGSSAPIYVIRYDFDKDRYSVYTTTLKKGNVGAYVVLDHNNYKKVDGGDNFTSYQDALNFYNQKVQAA